MVGAACRRREAIHKGANHTLPIGAATLIGAATAATAATFRSTSTSHQREREPAPFFFYSVFFILIL